MNYRSTEREDIVVKEITTVGNSRLTKHKKDEGGGVMYLVFYFLLTIFVFRDTEGTHYFRK